MSKEIKKVNERDFFRLKDGPDMYCMSENTFAKLAKDSGARYEVGRVVLINKAVFNQYLESFRVV